MRYENNERRRVITKAKYLLQQHRKANKNKNVDVRASAIITAKELENEYIKLGSAKVDSLRNFYYLVQIEIITNNDL